MGENEMKSRYVAKSDYLIKVKQLTDGQLWIGSELTMLKNRCEAIENIINQRTPQTPKPCEHEWGKTGQSCTKCGVLANDYIKSKATCQVCSACMGDGCKLCHPNYKSTPKPVDGLVELDEYKNWSFKERRIYELGWNEGKSHKIMNPEYKLIPLHYIPLWEEIDKTCSQRGITLSRGQIAILRDAICSKFGTPKPYVPSVEEIESLFPQNPYPESVFTEPTKEQYALAHKVLVENGMCIDMFSGSMGRHVWNFMKKDYVQAIREFIEEK